MLSQNSNPDVRSVASNSCVINILYGCKCKLSCSMRRTLWSLKFKLATCFRADFCGLFSKAVRTRSMFLIVRTDWRPRWLQFINRALLPKVCDPMTNGFFTRYRFTRRDFETFAKSANSRYVWLLDFKKSLNRKNAMFGVPLAHDGWLLLVT